MDFEDRLQRAIERGQKSREQDSQLQAIKTATEEELRELHATSRNDICDYLETCLKKVAESFPGFIYKNVLGDEGWGSKITRDDFLAVTSRQKENVFSRLEMVIKPYSKSHILEVSSKATIRNKELYHRNHFQQLQQLELASYKNLIDLWVLEFAEGYARNM